MGKIGLMEIIRKLLKTEADLEFLSQLSESELKTLIVCIRERVDGLGKQMS